MRALLRIRKLVLKVVGGWRSLSNKTRTLRVGARPLQSMLWLNVLTTLQASTLRGT